LRLIIALCLCLTLLPAAAPAAPEEDIVVVTKQDIMALLAQIPDIAPVREDMRALGFRGENLELAVAQNRAFYTDPVIAGHIAEQVMMAYANPGQPGQAQGLIWPLIDRGLGHLPTRKLRYYYEVESTMIHALPVAQCGRIIRNDLSAEAHSDAMSRMAARLNAPALKEYYAIQLRAARLGANRRAVRLSRAQFDRVRAGLDAQMDVLVAGTPRPESIIEAMRDLRRADDRRACVIGRLMYDAVMRLEGQVQRDALIFMSAP